MACGSSSATSTASRRIAVRPGLDPPTSGSSHLAACAFLAHPEVSGSKPRFAGYFLDPARQTSRGGGRDLTFTSWTKSMDGRQVKHNFAFQGASAAKGDDEDEGSSRPSVADWTHGKVEIKIFEGVSQVLANDCHSANRACHTNPAIPPTVPA